MWCAYYKSRRITKTFFSCEEAVADVARRFVAAYAPVYEDLRRRARFVQPYLCDRLLSSGLDGWRATARSERMAWGLEPDPKAERMLLIEAARHYAREDRGIKDWRIEPLRSTELLGDLPDLEDLLLE